MLLPNGYLIVEIWLSSVGNGRGKRKRAVQGELHRNVSPPAVRAARRARDQAAAIQKPGAVVAPATPTTPARTTVRVGQRALGQVPTQAPGSVVVVNPEVVVLAIRGMTTSKPPGGGSAQLTATLRG